jgi:ribosome biogenesis GTPase A
MPPKRSGKSTGRLISTTQFRQLQELIGWVDLVIEVLDARLPISSRHPNSDKIFRNKERLTLFTKSDLADVKKSSSLISTTPTPLFLSLKERSNKNKVTELALQLTKDKRDQAARKGLLPRPMRVCVVGMPNVGKSSLINWLTGRKMSKVADRPGVTRGKQWVRVHPQLELLDTPGILPPFAYKKDIEVKLALFNLLPESTYNFEEVALAGLNLLKVEYAELLSKYLRDPELAHVQLENIALRKNFLTSGGKPDTQRAACTFITDLRKGRIGRITLDQPT